MNDPNRHGRIQDLDVTLWVGKHGIEAVVDELANQFDDRDLVKVKFHRAARAGTDTDSLARELADRVDASVLETRGHTAVIER
jgi:RNA-binding protein